MICNFVLKWLNAMKYFSLIIFLINFLPQLALADEEQTKKQLEEISKTFVSKLSMDKKFVLKSLSPDATGLPEDFLKKLTSDFEAALLMSSDFEIKLANRSTMEDVWQEAIEFNNADFEKLFKQASSDVMLMMVPRAVRNGVEINITAYSLSGNNVGQILASSGSLLLALDLKQNLGVDLNDLNEQMAKVLAEIEKVGESGGVIKNPDTYAEFYHNGRILQQRGEMDLAMRNYEQAIAEGYLFVDPLFDILDIANARYGEIGTKKYFDKKIKNSVPKQLALMGEIILGSDPILLVEPILKGEILFSPLLATWLEKTFLNWNYFDTLTIGQARAAAGEIIMRDYKSGKFQSFYIDKIRGATVGESSTQMFTSMSLGSQMVIDRNSISRTTTFFERNNDKRPKMRGFDIQDQVDTTKPIIFCAKKFDDVESVCKTIDPRFNVFTNPDTKWFGFNSGAGMDWAIGMHCAVSVSYTDIHGFNVESPVFVNHEQREVYKPIELDKVIQCAGDYYRPRR